MVKCLLETPYLSSADSRCIISRKIPKMPYDKTSSWFQVQMGWYFFTQGKPNPLCRVFCPFSSTCDSGASGVFFKRETPKFCDFFSQRTTLPLEDLPSSEEFQHDVKPWSQKNFIFKGNLLNVMIIPSLIFLLIWDFLVAYLQIHSIIIINNSEGSTRILLPL